jgi:hypothetical protein
VKRVVLAAAILALAVGCGRPAASSRAPAEPDAAADALRAVEQGDWAVAAERLRTALRQDPTSLKLHYSLAIVTSHLRLTDEAVREFQWVVANVAPELPEAQVARRWLAEAGLLARPAAEWDPEASELTSEETPGDSGLSGRVLWADGKPTARVQLFLKGAPQGPLEHLQWVLRTDDEGRFEFQRIPAGTYMLTNRLAGTPIWRLRVRLTPGGITTLELSEANSARIRDDFPDA